MSTPPHAFPLLLLALVAALAVAVAVAEDRPIPDFLKICRRNDPELSACVKESVETLRPRLAEGIPELNVPPMEPLYLKQLVLNDNPNLRITANDIQAYRTSQFQIDELKVDVGSGEYRFHLDFPGMNIVGRYAVNGRVLLLPIKGEGPLTLNISETSADVLLRSEMVQKNGEEYLSFKSLDVKIRVSGGTIRLDNLFNGDRVLGEVINSAVNLNFERALDELRPSVEKALGETLLEIAQGVVNLFPARQLLPTT